MPNPDIIPTLKTEQLWGNPKTLELFKVDVEAAGNSIGVSVSLMNPHNDPKTVVLSPEEVARDFDLIDGPCAYSAQERHVELECLCGVYYTPTLQEGGSLHD